MAIKSSERKSEMSVEQAREEVAREVSFVINMNNDERKKKSEIVTEDVRSGAMRLIVHVFMFASVQGFHLQSEQLKNETFVSGEVANGPNYIPLSLQGLHLPNLLWDNSATKLLKNKAYKSIFVSGIANGTLDPNYYGSYYVQDAWWVYEVGKLWGHVSRSTNDTDLKKFAGDKEISWVKYGQGMFQEFSIPINATCATPGKAANDYFNYINASIQTQPAYMAITSYPCEKLWNYWQTRCNRTGNRVDNVYYDYWCVASKPPIRHEELIQKLYDKGLFGNNIVALLKMFLTGMRHEVSFFNGATPGTLATAAHAPSPTIPDSKFHEKI